MFGSRRSAETSVPRVADADRADQRERSSRAAARATLGEQRDVELGRRRPRPVKTIRGCGSASSAGSTGPGLQRRGEQRGVGDVRRVEHVVGAASRMRSASGGALASTRSARRAKRSSAARKLSRVDSLLGGDVVDAVVDDERRVERLEQRLGLRDVGPQDRLAEPEPPRRAAHQAAQQPRVERAHGARCRAAGGPAARARAGRRRARGGAQPAPQAPRDPAQVAPGELRPAQARATRRTAPGCRARQPRHQVLLVRPQLGVPVGEADADDVAAAQAVGGRPRRSRRVRTRPANPVRGSDRLCHLLPV